MNNSQGVNNNNKPEQQILGNIGSGFHQTRTDERNSKQRIPQEKKKTARS